MVIVELEKWSTYLNSKLKKNIPVIIESEKLLRFYNIMGEPSVVVHACNPNIQKERESK